jgi:AraC-like DNA-binding protein
MNHPRQRSPELESNNTRDTRLGYEDDEGGSVVRYLEHGIPNPLVRWHYHEEYELHLIVATTGKVFVGDYIGQFAPGHLVLTGPRLPHNWISNNPPGTPVPLRDVVLQFAHEPVAEAAQRFPELRDALPMLERARHGIEFFGLSALARERFTRIKASRGLRRLCEFLEFLAALVNCSDYRLLSSVQLQSNEDDASLARLAGILNHLTENCSQPFSMAELAREAGMSESQFSRYFRRATGNSFTDFVNRLRVNKACQLLLETDRYITNICYDAGFNNVANFNRRFLEIKGVTPKKYRQEAHERFGR